MHIRPNVQARREERPWLCNVASSYVHIFSKGELMDLNDNSLAQSDVWNPESHTLPCMKHIAADLF